MTELEVDATSFTDPREWKWVMLDAAPRRPSDDLSPQAGRL